jgi:hypothetical protein
MAVLALAVLEGSLVALPKPGAFSRWRASTLCCSHCTSVSSLRR